MAKEKQTEEVQVLSKYEKARVIGSRALQISMGAPVLVKLSKEELTELRYNPLEIAKKEFEAGVIPISVIREVSTAKNKVEDKPEEKSE